MDDWKLLQKFADDGDDDSFARVVKEHIGLVYATALRMTSDAAASEDITQSVFILLADKADLLNPHGALASWLYQSTVLKSRKYLARERNRTLKEEKSAPMMNQDSESMPNDWHEIRPLIDEALSDLPEEDRSAILLRFFQEDSYQAIGSRLSVSEEAARKRVTRAVRRLNSWFASRGMNGTEETMTRQLSGVILVAPPASLFQDTLNAVASKSVGATSAAGGSLASGFLSKPLILAAFLGGTAVPVSQFLLKEETPQANLAHESHLEEEGSPDLVTRPVEKAQDEWSRIWQESIPPKGSLQNLLVRINQVEDPFKRDLFKAMATREWVAHGFPLGDDLDNKYLVLEDLIAIDPHRAAEIVKDFPPTQANLSSKLASLARVSPETLGHFIRLLETPLLHTIHRSFRLGSFAGPKVSDHQRARSIRESVAIALTESPQSAETILKELEGWHLEHALAGMMEALAPQDISNALSLLKARSDSPGTKGRALGIYLESWSLKDPQKAFSFLEEFKKDSNNRKQFGSDLFSSKTRSLIIASLAEQDLDAALTILENEKSNFGAASELGDVFARELVKDPTKILSALSGNYKNTGAMNALSSAIYQDPMTTFPMVWEWCEDQGATPFVKKLVQHSIRALVDTDLELVLSYYQKNPSLFNEPPFRNMTYAFTLTSLQESFDFLDRIPQEHQSSFAAGLFGKINRVGNLWSDDEKARLYGFLSPIHRPEAARVMVKELALANPQEAFARVEEFETPAEINSATQEVIAQWVTFDPAAASNWVDDLDHGAQRKAATIELVRQFIQQENFESAWAWALDLESGPARERNLLSVVKEIKDTQSSTAAELWIQDEALSQTEFNSLQDALKSSK